MYDWGLKKILRKVIAGKKWITPFNEAGRHHSLGEQITINFQLNTKKLYANYAANAT